jgi:hypothetical protein
MGENVVEVGGEDEAVRGRFLHFRVYWRHYTQ